MAQFLASNVLLLLALAIALLGFGVWVVVATTRVSVRHADLLWSWIDLVVPGRLWRPRTYLIVHLVLGLILLAAVAAFALVAENVLAGRQLAAFDIAFARALRATTSPAWQSVFRLLTLLGTGSAITAVTGVVAWLLIERGEKVLAIMWCISQGGSGLLNYAMKSVFARTRPEGADPALFGTGLSFPSGHAMGSLVLCGVGAYLLLRLVPSQRSRVLLIVLLLALPLLIGFSRMYLGVHYFSDVVAGYLAAMAWIAICVSGAEVALRRNRRVRAGAP